MALGDDSLLVRMAVDSGQLRQQLDQAQSAITGWSNSVKGALGGLMAGVSVAGAVTWITSITKGAIEAGDRLGELSKITGVSVETLSSLQIAAKTSGLDMELLAGTLGKMSKNLTGVEEPGSNAAKALGALGINAEEFKNARVEDRLFILADALEGVDNSGGDATAAMEMLVKGGSKLIPMIDGGSQSLRRMMQTAEALGLKLTGETVDSMDKVADTLTIMGMQSQGLGNQIAQKLMPTLEGLSKLWLDNAKEGNSFGSVLSTAVDGGLKVVVTAAVAAMSALKGVGSILGGVMSAATLWAQGEGKAGLDALKMGFADAEAASKKAGETVRQLWSNELPKLTEEEKKVTTALRERTKAIEEQRKKEEERIKAGKVAREEWNKAEKATQDLIAKSLGVSADYVEKLKALELWYSKNRDKTAEYKAAIEALIWAQDSSKAIAKQQEEAEKALAKALADATQEREKSLAAYTKETDKIAEKALQLELETAQLGLTKEAQAALTIELRNAEIIRLQALATSDMVLLAGQDEVDSINARIAALQRLNTAEGNLAAKGALVDAAKETKKEWSRVTGQIEQALTDALVQGFNSGKSVVKSIGEWIKNYFLTNIARSIAQSITGALTVGFSGIANAIGLGGSSGGSAAGGAGDLLNLGSLFGGSGALGSFGLTGLMSTLTGTGIGTSLGAAGSLIGGGNILGGLGMGLGSIAPYAAAAYGLYRIFSGVGTGRDRNPAQQNYSLVQSGGLAESDYFREWAPDLQSATAYDEVLGGIVQSVDEIVGKLGGTSAALNYGLFTSASPDNLGAAYRFDIRNALGQGVFNATANDVNEKLFQNIAEVLPRVLLTGLQQSNLPEEFAAIFASLDVNTATATQINEAIAKAIEAKESKDADVQATQDATIDTAEYTGQSVSLMREQLDLLDRIRIGIESLANRPIEVTINDAQVNGGVA